MRRSRATQRGAGPRVVMPGARTVLAIVCLATLCGWGSRAGVVSAQAGSSSSQSSGPIDQRAVDALLESAEALLVQQEGNQALPLLERALAGATQQGLENQQAQAHTAMGEVFFYTARYPAARDHGTQALEWYERAGNNAGVARSSQLLSMVEELSGNLPVARAHAQRAIAAHAARGNRRGRALSTLQLLRVTDADLSAQRRLYDQVIEDARAVGDVAIEARAWQSLGDHVFGEGEYEEALEHLTRAAALVETLNDPLTLGSLHNSLGRVYRAHGRLDEALRHQLEALALHEKAGSPFALLQSLNAVATVYQRMGDLAKARTYYERSLAIAGSGIAARAGSGSRQPRDAPAGHRTIRARRQNARASHCQRVDVYPARRLRVPLGRVSEARASPQDAFEAATKSRGRVRRR